MSRLTLGIAILTVLAQALSAGAGERGFDFTVRLMDWSSAPSGKTRSAVRIADAVFAKAGIHVRWLDCTPDVYGYLPLRECHLEAGPTDLQLTLSGFAPKQIPPAALGLAVYPESGFPQRSTIYSHRIRSLARSNGAAYEVILGFVMVHELGHLLLEHSSHSSTGVMKDRWNSDDLLSLSQGGLGFCGSQIRGIRANLLDRRIAVTAGDNPMLITRSAAHPSSRTAR